MTHIIFFYLLVDIEPAMKTQKLPMNYQTGYIEVKVYDESDLRAGAHTACEILLKDHYGENRATYIYIPHLIKSSRGTVTVFDFSSPLAHIYLYLVEGLENV